MSGSQPQLHMRIPRGALQISVVRPCFGPVTQSLVLIPDIGVCEVPQVIPAGTHAEMLALRRLRMLVLRCSHGKKDNPSVFSSLKAQ